MIYNSIPCDICECVRDAYITRGTPNIAFVCEFPAAFNDSTN